MAQELAINAPFALVRCQNFKIYFSLSFEKFDKPYGCKFIFSSQIVQIYIT